MSRAWQRVVLGVYVVCFAIGAFSHLRDFIAWGLLPYRSGPLAFRIFWTALLPLDLTAAVLLLLGRRRAGLAFSLGIMLVDVAFNTYAWRGLGVWQFAYAVQMQSLFLGFVLGSFPFLWQGRGR